MFSFINNKNFYSNEFSRILCHYFSGIGKFWKVESRDWKEELERGIGKLNKLELRNELQCIIRINENFTKFNEICFVHFPWKEVCILCEKSTNKPSTHKSL